MAAMVGHDPSLSGSNPELLALSRRRTAPVPLVSRDFETTLRSFRPIATFVDFDADHFGHQALHRETNRGMLTRERGKRTTGASNHVAPIAFDMSHSAQMLVQELACR
jgi:hypothetical protein